MKHNDSNLVKNCKIQYKLKSQQILSHANEELKLFNIKKINSFEFSIKIAIQDEKHVYK